MLALFRTYIPCAPCRRDAERMAVSELLARAFGPGTILSHDADGRPLIAGSDLCISVSHCRDEAVIAISTDSPVGVDIETWRPALVTTAHKWLTTAEMDLMATPEDYLRAWTTKEAIFKAMTDQPSGLIEIPLRCGDFAISHITSPGRMLTIAAGIQPLTQ